MVLRSIYILEYVYALVIQSCPTLWDPQTVAHQVPLSTELSRQEY